MGDLARSVASGFWSPCLRAGCRWPKTAPPWRRSADSLGQLPPRLLGLLPDRAAQVRDHRRELGAAALALLGELVGGLPGHVADLGADVLNQLLAALVRPVEVLPQAKECIGKNCHDMSPLGWLPLAKRGVWVEAVIRLGKSCWLAGTGGGLSLPLVLVDCRTAAGLPANNGEGRCD